MRQAYPGLYGNNPYNNPAMATGPEGDRLTNLKRAIDAIEHKLSGTQQPMMPSFPQQGYNSDLGMMQEQLNRLSTQISNPQPIPMQAGSNTSLNNDTMAVAAQIAQRQQMLNGHNPNPVPNPVPIPTRAVAQPAPPAPAVQAAPAPVITPAAAALPVQTAVSNGMELIGQHLNGLKKELVELKKQVSKPAPAQPSVPQKEIDQIAKAIAELESGQKGDEVAFKNLSKELEDMRSTMRKEMTRAVRSEISTSNGNQANEMSTRFDSRLDALTKELDSFSHKSVSDLGERIETLAQGLSESSLQSANAVTPRVDELANQMAGLRMTVDDLPQTLAISRLDERLGDLTSKLDGLSQGLAQSAPEVQSVSADDISSIEGRLDEIARALVAVSNNTSAASAVDIPEIDVSGIDRVEARMSELARAIDEISKRDQGSELQDIAVRIDGLTERLGSFEKYAESGDLGGASAMFAAPDIGVVEEQLRLLNNRIEEAAAQSQTSQLEEQLHKLAARVEEAASVNSTAAQMSNLEAQIGQIIRHMSKEEAAAAIDFSPLETRLGQIEGHLVGNQNFSLEAAQLAAQQAVALMGDQSEPGQIINALSQDLKSLQMTAENGNMQNAQTVENVQQTLGQVVERLISIEDSISNAPVPAQSAPAIEQTQSSSFSATNNMTEEASWAAASAVEEPHEGEQLGVIQQAAIDAGFATPPQEESTPLQVDAPSLSPADDIEKGLAGNTEDNALLEPGSAAPNLKRMVEEASYKLNETKDTIVDSASDDLSGVPLMDQAESLQNARPGDDLRPDAVAAARRALQATTAEMNSVRDEAESIKKATGKGLGEKIGNLKSSFDFTKLRKPLVMGAAALLLAVVAFKGASMFMGSDVTPVVNIETPEATTDEASTDKTNADEASTEMSASETSAPDTDKSIVRNVGEGMANAEDAAEAPEAKIESATTEPTDEAASPTVEVEETDEPATEVATTTDQAEPTNQEPSSSEATTPNETAKVETTSTSDTIEEATPSAAVIVIPASAGSTALVTAASTGDPKALFQIGMRYSDGNGVKRNMTESAKWFDMAAEKGFAPAQYSIGSLYEKGIGVERDVTKAADWYTKAAVQGNARAMHNLAVIHAMGNPPAVQPNMDKAVGWFQKAAKLGIKDSQFNLGILYGQGMGVPQNLSDSYFWFALAAKTGDLDAAAKRDEVANAMDPSDLDISRKVVNNWTPDKLSEAVNRVAVPKEWQGKGQAENDTSANSGQTNVKTAQSLLNKRGFNVGSPDGLMGPKTKRAIMEFQRSAGIPITGKVDKKLLKALDIQT